MAQKPPVLPKKKSESFTSPKNIVYEAIYDYAPTKKDELELTEGDAVHILDKRKDGWWKCLCNGKTGLVPSNYLNPTAIELESPLHHAAKRGNYEELIEILKTNVDVNEQDKSGSTPLHWAAIGGHVECLKALLNVKTINPNITNKLGDSALHNAAFKSHEECVQQLIDNGAKRNIKNKQGLTPSMIAKDPVIKNMLRDPVQIEADNEGYNFDSDDEFEGDDDESN